MKRDNEGHYIMIKRPIQEDTIIINIYAPNRNLYAEHIMINASLDELQAGIKIGGRNINNLRYVDDTTLWQKAKRN